MFKILVAIVLFLLAACVVPVTAAPIDIFVDSEVAQAAENIRRRLDHADAAWELQAGSLDTQLDEAMQSLEVEAELAARMERLGI